MCLASSTNACKREIVPARMAAEAPLQQQVLVQALELRGRSSPVEPMQEMVAMLSARWLGMNPTMAETNAWEKVWQPREMPKDELFSARYRLWYGTRSPSMSSKVSRWYMQRHPCCGSRGHCAIEYVQYCVGFCRMQFNRVMQS